MQGQAITIPPAAAVTDDPERSTPRDAAAGRAPKAGGALRGRAASLMLWLVPLAVFATFIALTYALWQAERSLESYGVDAAAVSRRASSLVLWGGLAISLLTSLFVYLALLYRGRANDRTRRYLRSLESLQSNASSIIARVDAGAGALTELCES